MRGKLLALTMAATMTAASMTGCGGAARTPAPAGVDVTVDEALKLWQDKAAVIIDVRTAEEYREGHIPGAPLIPLAELAGRAGEVPRDKKVLIICRSGNRSAQATKLLRDKGFDNVYNIAGGIKEWRGPIAK